MSQYNIVCTISANHDNNWMSLAVPGATLTAAVLSLKYKKKLTYPMEEFYYMKQTFWSNPFFVTGQISFMDSTQE